MIHLLLKIKNKDTETAIIILEFLRPVMWIFQISSEDKRHHFSILRKTRVSEMNSIFTSIPPRNNFMRSLVLWLRRSTNNMFLIPISNAPMRPLEIFVMGGKIGSVRTVPWRCLSGPHKGINAAIVGLDLSSTDCHNLRQTPKVNRTLLVMSSAPYSFFPASARLVHTSRIRDDIVISDFLIRLSLSFT